jgi:hypothetical protein
MRYETKRLISGLSLTHSSGIAGLYFIGREAFNYLSGPMPRGGEVLLEVAVPMIVISSAAATYGLLKDWKDCSSGKLHTKNSS